MARAAPARQDGIPNGPPGAPAITGGRMYILLAIAGIVAAGCGSGSPPPDQGEAQAPHRRAAVPGGVEREVHARLHALPRDCNRGRAGKESLRQTTRSFIRYYRQYPSGRYRLQIDGESGTMLSALLVVREELLTCAPALAREITAVLPRNLQRGA